MKIFSLRQAATNGHFPVITYLLDKTEQLYPYKMHSLLDVCLSEAAINGHLPVVKYLVDKIEQLNPCLLSELLDMLSNKVLHYNIAKYISERRNN